MNVAKWLLLCLLALPLMELAAFIAVAATIGFGLAPWSWCSLARSSVPVILRHAGGSHIARVRVAMGEAASPPCKPTATGGLILSPEFCC